MTEHWWTYRTGKCRAGCPGCALTSRRRLRSKLSWLLIVAGWILIGFSFPADGLLGIALSLAGIALFTCALIVIRKAGDGR